MMMRPKIFDHVHVFFAGNNARAIRITCGRCDHNDVVRMTPGTGHDKRSVSREETLAIQRFGDMGWHVGKVASQHLCQHCRMKNTSNGTPNGKVTIMATPAAPAAAPQPREMTRADRRIIFAKLEDVYGTENTGYKDDWTDVTVAKDLGVPPAWVATIRDESFGSIGSNSDIDAKVAQAKAMVDDLKKTAATLLAKADDIQNRIIDVQKRVRP